MWLKAPSGGRLNILDAFEGCSRNSSVSSVSQGTPVPLKSLLRDHDGGKEDKILEPQLKSSVNVTVVQAAPPTVAPSYFPHPCICPPFPGPAGTLPVQWKQWENAHFTFCRQEWFGQLFQLGKKAQTLVQIVQMFGFCTSSSDTSQGFS